MKLSKAEREVARTKLKVGEHIKDDLETLAEREETPEGVRVALRVLSAELDGTINAYLSNLIIYGGAK